MTAKTLGPAYNITCSSTPAPTETSIITIQLSSELSDSEGMFAHLRFCRCLSSSHDDHKLMFKVHIQLVS